MRRRSASLRLEPYRLRVFPGSVLLGEGGEVLRWSRGSSDRHARTRRHERRWSSHRPRRRWSTVRSWENFSYTERDGHLFIVTINRPEVMNALHPPASAELSDGFDEFAADPDLWVAIVTGAGHGRSAPATTSSTRPPAVSRRVPGDRASAGSRPGST